MWDKAASIREPEHLGAWMARVAHNECLSVLRQAKRNVSLAPSWEAVAPDDPAEEAVVELGDASSAVRVAWESLDSECRQLLSLCFQDPPLSYDTIAELMGVPRGRIGPRRQRCLKSMRRSPGVARMLHEEKGTTNV